MAQVRAATIAPRTSRNTRQPGHPPRSRAATAIEASANGKAKTVWEKRTNSPHFRTCRAALFVSACLPARFKSGP